MPKTSFRKNSDSPQIRSSIMNNNHSLANYGTKLAWFYEFKGMPVDPFTLEQLQHFVTIIPHSTLMRATGLSRTYLEKIRVASDNDLKFRGFIYSMNPCVSH
jgi:hypothetical protein